MGLTERHWFENEDVPENYEWALEDDVYNSHTNEKLEDYTEEKLGVKRMVDREKVIKALECRKKADKRCVNPCEDTGLCHYATAVQGLDGEIYKPFICDRERICADALAMLKEQEPALPTWSQGKAYCGECGQRLPRKSADRKINYCSYCGRAVKWE